MAASRTDLLAWLNDLLQINYTKVEQCGSGGAYCQILDSIYGDIPMKRVKMNAKHEYEFVANYKVMQNVFKAKKIDKPIPVDKLVKCKMQDNLEFLQWMKRFWDANFGGQGYDAVGRRDGGVADPPATVAPLSTARSGSGNLGVGSGRAGGKTPIGGHRSGSAQSNANEIALQGQVRALTEHLEGLEKERDFYFAKLRDIEILVQQQMEVLEAEEKEDATLKSIQAILYSTEDGFEVPEGEAALVDEEETF
ncbi:hypothetical protein C0991_004141 [Blastosporella zonata]|nr:hypothetical protein C0991_004141 [Blastosporella zonata]